VPSGDAATFEIELKAERAMRFDEVAAFMFDGLGRRVGVIDLRQPSGLHEAHPDRNLKLSARFAAIPLVEGEYRVGASIRCGDAHQIVYDLITLDVTAKPNAEMVPYRAEIRGLVAFDYTVRSLTGEAT
jgi:hypothetical protein